MARTILYLSLSLAGLAAQAQNWCPPGATWTCTYSNGWTTEGFARFSYVGDTLVDGAICQKIDRFIEAWYFPFDTLLSGPASPVITKVDGDLVSIFTGSGFDTLYHFGAVPGDHWSVPVEDGMVQNAVVTITDTGTTIIDGMALHYVAAGQDTMVERLGSLSSHMIPWVQFIVDVPGGSLRCYQDGDINYQAPWWNHGCESWLATTEAPGGTGFLVFQNPGADRLMVQLPPGGHLVMLCDATGREVFRRSAGFGAIDIDTSLLKRGPYVVQVVALDGTAPRRCTWLKE